MRKKIDAVFAVIDKVFEIMAAIVLGGMTLLITAQVVFRYLLNSPLAWSEELARFGFIWMTFIAGYVGSRKAQHISVELVQDLFPATVKKGMKAVSFLIASGFFFMVCYYLITGWGKLASQLSPALKLPMNYVYFGMLIGCIFMGFSYLFECVKQFLPEDKEAAK